MGTRRSFLQTASLLPPLLAGDWAWSAAANSRKALVIGNSNYRDAPLLNPSNDAKAIGSMLRETGFGVSEYLNVRRPSMAAAVEEFMLDIASPQTQLVLLYYAGHGIQLDWRNYLLPVDAVADSATTIRNSSIDLNDLMGQFAKLKGKTFVVIMDACRNNPFGSSYRPEQKGLSQFDAPVGSLLAYATSPGNVASDGSGQNGLYTENLLRELAVPGARIEDALKRVRLNVRLASQGAQVPWETTSLENDVVINESGQKKLTEAEQEKLLEEDFAAWGRIKQSQKVDDWVQYLRTFPNGRFAEIAQNRLNRLLAEAARPVVPVSLPVASAATVPVPAMPTLPAVPADAQAVVPAGAAPKPEQKPTPEVATPAAPTTARQNLELGPGKPVPPFIQRSDNPYSAGRYPLARVYSVGDAFTLRLTDLLTGVVRGERTTTVTAVNELLDRVEFNRGETVSDTMGNYLRDVYGNESEVPMQMFPAELQVGKTWQSAWNQVSGSNKQRQRVELNFRITAFEKVEVPAGVFEAFRIEIDGFNFGSGPSFRREQKVWVVPGFGLAIKMQALVRISSTVPRGQSAIVRSDLYELVSASVGVKASACTVAQGTGLSRNFVVRQGCS